MLNIFQEIKSRLNVGVRSIVGSGAPTDGTTGAGDTGPGSTYVDYTNNREYINIGTLASPVWFDKTFGAVKNIRTRLTAAQVNAGATLLAAVAGYKYRIADAKMIAIGGNAGGATGVDIKATQGASVIKILAVAVAALTRSTVVRAGAANAVVLADGASFVSNDSNTAVTAIKDGGDLTTATHVDFILDYVVEKA